MVTAGSILPSPFSAMPTTGPVSFIEGGYYDVKYRGKVENHWVKAHE
jgi:hypothetical protein